MKKIVAREETFSQRKNMFEHFDKLITGSVDSILLDSVKNIHLIFSGLPFPGPVAQASVNISTLNSWLDGLKSSFQTDTNILIAWDNKNKSIKAYSDTTEICSFQLSRIVENDLISLLMDFQTWSGELTESGEHRMGLKGKAPGPHFFINMLLGNRVGFPHPLQTTPKSVVDRFGRGSFRSHADTQVLATRWDILQEENGNPCNRQFYLFEGNEQIFYSADVNDDNIVEAECLHSQNSTTINYNTRCGLEIRRKFFLPVQKSELPLACEIQEISITNNTKEKRNIRLVYTGMFGSGKPGALQEDVLYSTIIMQAGVIKDNDNRIVAISPDYYPMDTREDLRFHSMKIHRQSDIGLFPSEFSTSYQEFFGNGSLEKPQGALNLSNRLNLRGPGFFALASKIEIESGSTIYAENYTGLVSSKSNPDFSQESLIKEVQALHKHFNSVTAVKDAFDEVKTFYEDYASFLNVKTSDPYFSAYCSKNLPFQVLYQTFVSRSFGQTQKGYREIGFREIQDLFASMYYFQAMGKTDFIKDLLEEWITKVFIKGYAYHNFFWKGKEAGKWSDDALWLVQAVSRYVKLTGDKAFLNQPFPTADGPERVLIETLKAILRYSGEFSIGKHGLPLLDLADWNDCLKLDGNYQAGPFKQQNWISDSSEIGPGKNDFMESIMNAFLLKLAADEFSDLAAMTEDLVSVEWANKFSKSLYQKIQTHGWKKNFFTRLLINKPGEYSYAGGPGDGLSTDSDIDGTYFLNSFSWSILSSTATEEQISSMLNILNKYLKTPHGFKLVSPMDLSRVDPDAATSEYFPGDRENGAVFKHASMMAVCAMLKGAKQVNSHNLAKELASSAWWMIDIVMPFRTMSSPFEIAGNPRFCTQYNNSETGENIGPLLSGTSTWLILALLDAFGISYQTDKIILNPVLREEDREVKLIINEAGTRYNITMSKAEGFKRLKDCKDNQWCLNIDGKVSTFCEIPLFRDKKEHQVEFKFL
ncbi:MAG: hypothetical protein PF447_15110 [Spirochaetaceae bacterium]|nr:hypothetical protein [Spirochaetaceae bacterium]